MLITYQWQGCRVTLNPYRPRRRTTPRKIPFHPSLQFIDQEHAVAVKPDGKKVLHLDPVVIRAIRHQGVRV